MLEVGLSNRRKGVLICFCDSGTPISAVIPTVPIPLALKCKPAGATDTGNPCVEIMTGTAVVFISLIRMRSKRDIKMGRLCTPGGAVLGIVGGGRDVPFFKW